MKRFLLSLIPAISYILFGAHLMFHGMPIYIAALPLIGLVMLFFRGPLLANFQSLIHVGFAAEWAWSGYELTMRRIEMGARIHPAMEIMAGVSIFCLVAAAIYIVPVMRRKPEVVSAKYNGDQRNLSSSSD